MKNLSVLGHVFVWSSFVTFSSAANEFKIWRPISKTPSVCVCVCVCTLTTCIATCWASDVYHPWLKSVHQLVTKVYCRHYLKIPLHKVHTHTHTTDLLLARSWSLLTKTPFKEGYISFRKHSTWMWYALTWQKKLTFRRDMPLPPSGSKRIRKKDAAGWAETSVYFTVNWWRNNCHSQAVTILALNFPHHSCKAWRSVGQTAWQEEEEEEEEDGGEEEGGGEDE